MKCLNVALIGLIAAGLTTACSSETPLDGTLTESTEARDVSFSIAIPDMLATSRAEADLASVGNSGRGGLTNVDMTQYDLRYQLAVYTLEEAEGEEGTLVWKVPTQTVASYEPVNFSLRLTPNRSYRVIAWADFVEAGSTTDLHYQTADLAHINLVAGSALKLNDESRDAFFISDTIVVGAASYCKSLTLRRPFAKLRIVTTDWQLYGQGLEMPDQVTIGYKNCNRYSGLNLLTSKATGKSELADDDAHRVIALSELSAEKEYALGYDASPNNRTLMVDYLMTDNLGAQEPILFTFESSREGRSIAFWNIDTDIPMRRNWLTTLIGNMLTFGGTFTVDIAEDFDNEIIHEF